MYLNTCFLEEHRLDNMEAEITTKKQSLPISSTKFLQSLSLYIIAKVVCTFPSRAITKKQKAAAARTARISASLAQIDAHQKL